MGCRRSFGLAVVTLLAIPAAYPTCGDGTVCSGSGASCTAQGCRGKSGLLQLATACCAVLTALLGAKLLLYIAAVYCHAKRWARVFIHTDERTLGLAALRLAVLPVPPPRRRCTIPAAAGRCTIPAVAGRCTSHRKLLGVGKQTPTRSAFRRLLGYAAYRRLRAVGRALVRGERGK